MRINNITVGNDQPFILIAGPCAIENLNDTLYHAENIKNICDRLNICLLYTSPSPRDATLSRMPSSA